MRTEAIRKRMSETRKQRLASGQIKTWNKGLTKKDPRVRKYLRGGEATQFKPGPRPETKGKNNANWKGGKALSATGYVLVRVPDHPAAQNDYVFEHRLVMEKHLGRLLRDDEVVHHKDHDRRNNKLRNLLLMTHGDHASLHNHIRWDGGKYNEEG